MKETKVVNIHKTKEYDVYIGRGSKWGNPYPIVDYTNNKERITSCKAYEGYFWDSGLWKHIDELKGRTLGCYCKPKRCHGDFLSDVANGKYDDKIKKLSKKSFTKRK